MFLHLPEEIWPVERDYLLLAMTLPHHSIFDLSDS